MFLVTPADPVKSRPSMEVRVRVVETEIGREVELPCVASGFPLPAYSWRKDGVGVVLRTPARVSQKGGNLVLAAAGLGDSGTYTCTANNSLGTQTATVQLSVTGISNFIYSLIF